MPTGPEFDIIAPDDFAAMALEAQQDYLEAAVAGGAAPADLLDLCATVRDHAPMAYLSRHLQARGWLRERATAAWFSGFLLEQPDTAVHKVLRHLTEPPPPTPQRASLLRLLEAAWVSATLDRLPALCLIDRAYKHHFPKDRDRALDAHLDTIRAHLDAGEVDAIPLDALALVPGRLLEALRQRAAAGGGPEALERFDARREALAARAIALLGDVPKGVSQANAEELLARRVYTDPGHFLVELLQNAEDSGATRWTVRFHPNQIVVWHDGAPFDARDLVGVTSIGQTTKRKTQIGFFGVGFKSVYEITARPRIYSDVYRFEIADVSIPKRLASLPDGVPAEGTTLVLPLLAPEDEARSSAALYDKARALDPVVLLTLRNIKRITLERVDADGARDTHEIAAELGEGPVATLVEGTGDRRDFLLRTVHLRYEGSRREASRARNTHVKVGLRWEDGAPAPLPEGSPTVYSFLPTAEPSGLRFFIQSHFDVPVDRERIAPESRWNRWILSRVPTLLAELAAELPALGPAEGAAARARGLLRVLPLSEELPGSHFQGLTHGLRRLLRQVPCLPCADGEVRAPDEVAVAPPDLAAALEGLPLRMRWLRPDAGEAPCHILAPDLEPRSLEVARHLGCAPLDAERLVDLLERALTEGEGAEPLVDALAASPARLARLYDLLLEHLEQMEREGRRLQSATLLERLRSLPLMADAEGNLHPPSLPWRASPALREVAGGARTWLAEALDPLCEPQDGQGGTNPVRLRAFYDRLGVRTFELSTLLAELERDAPEGSLDPADPKAPPVLAEPGRRRALLKLLLEATWTDLHAALRLPLLAARGDARLFPMARDTGDRQGALRPGEGEAAEALLGFYGARRPIAATEGEDALQADLLERVGGAALSVECLVYDLWTTPPLFSLERPEVAEALHQMLAAILADIGERARDRLGELPIWPDAEGELRPLSKGSGRARVPVSEAVCGLFPEVPFLAASIRDLPHVRALGGDVVGVEAVIGALAPDAAPPLSLTPTPEVATAVMRFVLDNLSHVRARSRRRLVIFSTFLDDRGEVCGIGELCRADPPELRALFAGWSDRRFVDPEGLTMEVVERLDLAGHLHPVDPATLVEDLHRVTGGEGARLRESLARCVPAEAVPGWLERVQATLVEHRELLLERFPVLPRPGLPPANPTLTGLPIWASRDGALLTAAEAVDDEALRELTRPGEVARGRVDAATLDDDSLARLRALAPMVAPRPAVDLLAELVEELARDGLSLAAQPPFLSTVGGLIAVVALMAEAEDKGHVGRCPLASADGRLRLAPLLNTDAETRALLQGLPLAADLVHPALPEALAELGEAAHPIVAGRLSALEPLDVINEVARHVHGDDALPQTPRVALLEDFWDWLATHERDVFTNAECRQRLRSAPLFETGQGRLVGAGELIIDPTGAVPTDLGMDWAPSERVPAETLQRLARNLDVGQPSPEELVLQHLLPAYLEATEARQRERAGALLTATGRLLDGRSRSALAELVARADGEVLIEDDRGTFRPPRELILPPAELRTHLQALLGDDLPTPSAIRYGDEVRPFLMALGVRRVPSAAELRERLAVGDLDEAASRGVAGVCGHLHREGVDVLANLPLGEIAWAVDGTGCLRRPEAVFLWSPEVEALIGALPELYVDEMIPLLLGRALSESVGFRTAEDVGLPEVVHHLRLRSQAGQPVAFNVYRWLERGLTGGRLTPHEVVGRLSPARWVCTDDGEFFIHRHVIGTRALRLFGTRRGYWERGRQECPALCRAFGIPAEVSAEVVSSFLEEVAGDVRQRGDQWALSRERALPRMLLACYAHLGRAGASVPETWPVILCRAVGRGSTTAGPPSRVRLLPARAEGLLRSDTPTLEALFRDAGTFYVAEPGEGEDRAAVARFLESAGVPRLRDAYAVVTEARPDQDRTTSYRSRIQQLRHVMEALLDVMPRVQLQRSQLDPEGWVFDQRLRALATTGAVAAIADLEVYYELPGVGRVPASMVAAWDKDARRLLVDTRALARIDRDTTGLAVGLLPTLYVGRGEDQLVDIVEILLPLRSAERMHRYLDRRHFPAAPRRAGPLDRLARRVGELLDYELHVRLQRRFGALDGADFSAWRRPQLFDPLREEVERDKVRGAELHRRAALALLGALGLADPPEELVGRLIALLGARSLSDVPADLLGGDLPEDAPDTFAPQPAPQDGDPFDLVPNEAAFAVGPTPGLPGPGAELDPIDWDAVLSELQPRPSGGVIQRLSRWLGIADDHPQAVATPGAPPPWATQDGNPMAPQDAIPPQLWANKAMRDRIAASPPGARLYYEPAPLPVPWLYGVHTPGVQFDPDTQSWSPGPIPSRRWFADLPASGHTVRFAGRLMPGWNQLPLPLLSRLAAPPTATDGTRVEAELTEPWGTQRAFVHGDSPVEVHLEVELLEAPPLTSREALTRLPPELLAPTLHLRELPRPVRRWVEQEAGRSRSIWERALAVQSFIRSRYAHDDDFLDRPEVQAAVAQLRAGVGHHHLQLLHASDDPDYIGRGVCFELNSLAVELLRHLRVPAMVASGWVFDLGVVDRPDHLFALVITPTAAGPCMMPIDGSAGAHGPQPLLPHHPDPDLGALDLDAPPPPAAPLPSSPWNFPDVGGNDVDTNLESLRVAEQTRLRREAQLLFSAIDLVCRVHRQPPPDAIRALRERADDAEPERLARQLRAAVAAMLGDADLVQPMIRMLRGDYDRLAQLPAPVRELVRRGYAEVKTVAVYAVTPPS